MKIVPICEIISERPGKQHLSDSVSTTEHSVNFTSSFCTTDFHYVRECSHGQEKYEKSVETFGDGEEFNRVA